MSKAIEFDDDAFDRAEGLLEKKNPFSKKEIKLLLRLHSEGLTLRQIGDRLGRNCSSVGNRLRIEKKKAGQKETKRWRSFSWVAGMTGRAKKH